MLVTSNPAQAHKHTAIALGNFDGLHRGHQQVIAQILPASCHSLSGKVGHLDDLDRLAPTSPVAIATPLKLTVESNASNGKSNGNHDKPDLIPTVVTFAPHPREFFSGTQRSLLTPLPEKIAILEQMGIAQLVLLPFDEELAQLSAADFIQKILIEQLGVQKISVGHDFGFGHKRQGTVVDLQKIWGDRVCVVPDLQFELPPDFANGSGSGQKVDQLSNLNHPPEAVSPTTRISSSVIRAALDKGEIKLANHLLGRPYALIGAVETGAQLGRKIGFPTANLNLPARKLLPRNGVYAVTVTILERKPTNPAQIYDAVMNIGVRPTVHKTAPVNAAAPDDQNTSNQNIEPEPQGESDPSDRTYSQSAQMQRKVEVHILDWSGDIYGQQLQVNLIDFLRPEQKFPSLDELKAQIAADCEAARQILQNIEAENYLNDCNYLSMVSG
ncbi:riboflavin biosynthesis protein RibF [Thalassoporum mexicanum PCC 7367]|uniref:bifunctional riboflavin kinase/FMN adenylyltransferase n=1 Tax=Thalassoporum mexicanum TaxID=3457544 RepID=UPI00029F9D81|nr:bifunctional riboflavin kinase/FMN adenylyltransferase [Pseudanabaena sp. PCC 7367]AFY70521.1 riboflavin biosynthesis protein RibF [Pseudanabaena sp. PCC 7367]